MNVAKYREAKKMTQQTLADAVGVTRQMISAIENGAMPSVNTLRKIAEVLGCSMDALFNDEKEVNQ